MKQIKLTQNRFALVDDSDFEWLNQFKWSVNSNKYVWRYTGRINRKTKGITMHKLIMKTPKGLQIDHINGDRFDNRRCNLRICTCSQNCMNRKATTKSTTGYRGVTRIPKYKAIWQARIEINGKKISLGFFDDPKQAALAYNHAALKYHGDFAFLNKL